VVDGKHMVSISAAVRKAIGLQGGDPIQVTLTVADTPQQVTIPADFAAALAADEQASVFFGKLSNSMQRYHIDNITAAKSADDWTILVLHAFWDSWLHERDVLLARGREHPTDGDATFYATSYGLFIAAAVASMFGDQVQEKLTLGGDGGGVFDLEARGAVTLTVTRATIAGPPADQVADALAGRAPVPVVLGDLPASSRAALSRMADFFNTPAGHSPG